MESIKSPLFEKFKFDQLKYPDYVRGGVINSTYGSGGRKIGVDGYTRCTGSSSYNSGGGVSSTDDDLENWKQADRVIVTNPNSVNEVMSAVNIATKRRIKF